MSMEAFIREIKQSKAVLKIITKTKNERFFIEKWIQHHLAIIGDGKLIIFDNMSDDEHVLNIYQKYKEHILLVKFDFYYDYVHEYKKCKEFYDALASSTEFFTILDTDEFLYFYDNNNAIHDTSILDYLKENNDCDFFAPCWLSNVEGQENILKINSEVQGVKEKTEVIELFDWGKPLVNSKFFEDSKVQEYNIILFRHTHELPLLNYKKAKTKFFIAHLKNLDKEQRITVNMNKLLSSGLISSATDFEGLFKLTAQEGKDLASRSFISQTQKLVKERKISSAQASKVPYRDKTFEIGEDGKLSFSNTFEEQAFYSLFNRSYLDLIDFNASKIVKNKFPLLYHWIGRYS